MFKSFKVYKAIKMNSTLIFIIFLSFAKFIDGITLTDIVQTNKGAVKGEILKTIHNLSIEYSSFRAIPYAKPPVGQLRFQVGKSFKN